MAKKIAILGAIIMVASFCNNALAQAPNGGYDFGSAVLSNTVAGIDGGVSCGIFNTPDLDVGISTMALRGNGETAVKFFLNDISYYTTDAQGNQLNAYTYAGSVIMTFSSASAGTLRWIAIAAGATYSDDETEYMTFNGVGTFSNYSLTETDSSAIKVDFDITIKGCTIKLDAALYR
jgi:hypothetical protein